MEGAGGAVAASLSLSSRSKDVCCVDTKTLLHIFAVYRGASKRLLRAELA